MSKTEALNRQELLMTAAENMGFESIEEMFAAAIYDGVAVGICKKCGYTTEVEPDGRGWCEECEKASVVSVLLIAGVI